MDKTYHAILGVTVYASAEEIRSAYRRMVKKYHPDRFEGGSGRFMQIQEAYSVLGDSGRRKAYEQALVKESEPLMPEQQPNYFGRRTRRPFHTPPGSFDDIFEWVAEHFYGWDHRPSRPVRSMKIEVPLTPSQALRGGKAAIRVPVRSTCPYCGGYGDDGFFECDACAGQGVVCAELPLYVQFPAGLEDEFTVVLPLERFGIPGMRLEVVFRV